MKKKDASRDPGFQEPLTSRAERPNAEGQPADYAINAQVRQTLIRRWVKPDSVEIGTTDGVVLLKGRIVRDPGGGEEAQDEVAQQRFLWRLRSELKAIPGVVDVIIEAPEAERTDRE